MATFICYYVEKGEMYNADFLMQLLNTVFMTFEDEKILFSRRLITAAKMEAMVGSYKGTLEEAFRSFNPSFKNKNIQMLFEEAGSANADTFREIMKVPYEEMIGDLHEGFISSLRAAYLMDVTTDEEEESKEIDEFMTYACFLLAETGRPELLNDLLFILGQDYEVLDNLFGDILTEKAWMPVCRLGCDQMPALVAFCKGPGDETCKNIVVQALAQIAVHFPECRAQAKASLLDLAAYCITEESMSRVEPDFASNLVFELAVFQDPDVLPCIKALYDHDLVDLDFAETYLKIKDDILNKTFPTPKLHLQDIFGLYEEIQESWNSGGIDRNL